MHLPAAIVEDRRTKLLPGGTERDGVDAGAIAGFEAYPQVRLTDLLRVAHGMRGQHDNRLWITRPEGSSAADCRHEIGIGRSGAYRPVDQKPVSAARDLHIAG